MRINADFSEAIALRTNAIDWVPSPIRGVDRRMLDRVGDEVARATSIVRYAPLSTFAEHTHDGGEEFIVLEGVFQDEHGDYPAGTYVRNPPGTHHIPASREGCVIFVKLWQFQIGDEVQTSIDLHQIERDLRRSTADFSAKTLFENDAETVELQRWTADHQREWIADDGTEILILKGSMIWRGEQYYQHDWFRVPDAYKAKMSAGADGAIVWAKHRHLRNIAAP
jgi:hypothetical protein